MKKLFTFLLCTGLASASFAQNGRDRATDDVLRGHGPAASYPANGDNCQAQIDALNRTYDAQVASLRADGRLSEADRAYKIRQTEDARRYKINEVRRNCNGNTAPRGNKGKVKGNNGNHYGWEKGKGNPHGNGKGKDKKD